MEKIICIYEIVNIKTLEKYVGSTRNYKQRKKAHWSSLKKGNHHSQFLQNSYNKHGIENFKISIILYCSVDSLIPLEQSFLNGVNYAFNMCRIAINYPNSPRKRVIFSKEFKDKMSNTLKRYYSKNPHPLKGKTNIHSKKGLDSISTAAQRGDSRRGKFLYSGIVQMDMSGNELFEHKNALEAQKAIGLKKPASSKIIRACKRPDTRSAYGFK